MPAVRAALRLLAQHRGQQPALLLGAEAHPALTPAAVLQPHRGLRRSLSAPDWDRCQTFAEVHLLATPSRPETQEYLALAARALKPGGRLYLAAENDLGADSWRKRLAPLETHSGQHSKLLLLDPSGLDREGDPFALRQPPGCDFWSCPGLFSWDHLDRGTSRLLEMLPPHLKGRGADFGCGPGLLVRALVERQCQEIHAVDVDERAVQATLRNVEGDPRVYGHWLDLTQEDGPQGLDWITLNPPFHGSGREQRELGFALVARACSCLRPGGELWLVVNSHLGYEACLQSLPLQSTKLTQSGGFCCWRSLKITRR